MDIVSFFSWCGWLDLWLKMAWFDIKWANEYDKTIHPTLSKNFPHTFVDTRDMRKIPFTEIPNGVWFVWWPPCQSWSEAWAWRWVEDSRGKLFFEYINIIAAKKPLFFIAENVSWILSTRHKDSFSKIIEEFKNIWYNLSVELVNANDYGVPEDRMRVIIVWYSEKLGKKYKFPKPVDIWLTLKDCIYDLKDQAVPALDKNYSNPQNINNNEYFIWSYSTIFMSRNRVRSWNEPSFTIQAWARHAPIHPNAPKMNFIEQNIRIFVPWKEHLYRRLSVRECARIQTFPDNFEFLYSNVTNGYKMIWNAVPVQLAYHLGKVIFSDLEEYFNESKVRVNADDILRVSKKLTNNHSLQKELV